MFCIAKWLRLFAVSLVFAAAAVAAGAPKHTTSSGEPSPVQTAILPAQFGGWQTASIQKSNDPAVADPANALPLKEYGFTDFAGATYTRNGSETLLITAARFADASGAYGAFTFYRTRPMREEKIGDRAASENNQVLFFRGNVLIHAVFQSLTAMSAAELRELASDIPLPVGNAANLPTLSADLPQQSRIENSAKYILGSATMQAVGAPISPELVGFNSGAELMQANYGTSGGEATLMIISYPTPQMAAQALRQIEGSQVTLTNPIYDKRTGPLVAVVSGAISQSEAKALLASVNYEANVTWNENTFLSKKDNVGNLIVNILLLCAIIGGLAIIAGMAFGGARILAKRLWPGKVFDRPEYVEFISLQLYESDTERPLREPRER